MSANIDTYLNQIANGVYGEDVRSAIHDAIEIVNNAMPPSTVIQRDLYSMSIDASTSLDDLKVPNSYYVPPSVSSSPFYGSWGYLKVFAKVGTAGFSVLHVAFKIPSNGSTYYNTTSFNIYLRAYNGDSDTWSNWYIVDLDSQVSALTNTIASNLSTAKAYTDSKVATEAAARVILSNTVAQNLNTAKAYTDSKVAQEAQARTELSVLVGQNLEAAKDYTDSKVLPGNSARVELNNATIGFTNLDDRLDSITSRTNDAVRDLNYELIKVNSFTASPSVVENGSTVTSVVFNWSLSKTPTILTIDSIAVPLAQSGAYTRSELALMANKTFYLVTSDAGSPSNPSTTVTKGVVLQFLNKVHWGVSTVPSSINDAFLLSTLSNHELTGTRERSITVNPGSGNYIWYAQPSSFGTPTFSFGGVAGGFKLVSTFNHTNSSGKSVSYQVYRSDNANLGSTVIKIS